MENSIKKMLCIVLLSFSALGLACDACKLQQPKITRNITHGIGPDSGWDWFIVGIVILITILTLIYSIKFLFRPGEKNENHIKYKIFSN